MTRAELNTLNDDTIFVNNNRQVTEQKLHDLVESILAGTVLFEDIIDNLTSTDGDKALSAAQGKFLKGLIDLLQGSLVPQGNWNANTNTPNISIETETGYYWIVSAAGSTDIGGITDWGVNDWVIKTDNGWAKIDNSLIASEIPITDVDNNFNAINVETALNEIGETKFWNGFDRHNPDTIGTLSWDNSTRTFSIHIQAEQPDFHFWAGGKKFIKATTESIVIPDTTGVYMVYFDTLGVIQYIDIDSITDTAFLEWALIAMVRWNATQGSGDVGDERHGIRMSGSTHQSIHEGIGALYVSGLDLVGLTDGGTTYSQTNSGYFRDEDIKHHPLAQTTNRFMYRLGTAGEWTILPASNSVGYKASGDSYYSWNEWTGSTWQLTEGTSTTDYFIMFFIAIPNIVQDNMVTKTIGQNAYSTVNKARDAIESELSKLDLRGLVSPEIRPLKAVIINRNGKVKKLSDGSLYYDLTKISTIGSGGASPTVITGDDVSLNTSSFDGILSSADDDVQKALETIDKQEPVWQTPALQNSWVNYGNTYETCKYSKNNRTGEVTIRGLLKGGNNTTYSTVFTLPTGYAPVSNIMTLCYIYEGYVKVVIYNGEVRVYANEAHDGNVNIYTSLNIKFFTN